jgi:hypothetical protein
MVKKLPGANAKELTPRANGFKFFLYYLDDLLALGGRRPRILAKS